MVRTYFVPGISCDNCRAAIEREVVKVDGVERVVVDVDAKTVRVEGDAADAALRSAIDESGYDIEEPSTT